MSSHRGDLAFTNPFQEKTSSPQKLSNSRCAPGGFEDQRIADQKIAIDQAPNNKATTPPATSIHTSRWSTGPVEQNKTQRKTKSNQKCYSISERLPSNLRPRQQRRGTGTNTYKPSPAKTTATPRRLIGPLSEEEESVKMENPFLDPEKHQGLGSSRWVNDDDPSSSVTQTTVTPRRIIGPLSDEEKTVHMENPFFDPKKHKGLGSSRWANE